MLRLVLRRLRFARAPRSANRISGNASLLVIASLLVAKPARTSRSKVQQKTVPLIEVVMCVGRVAVEACVQRARGKHTIPVHVQWRVVANANVLVHGCFRDRRKNTLAVGMNTLGSPVAVERDTGKLPAIAHRRREVGLVRLVPLRGRRVVVAMSKAEVMPELVYERSDFRQGHAPVRERCERDHEVIAPDLAAP